MWESHKNKIDPEIRFAVLVSIIYAIPLVVLTVMYDRRFAFPFAPELGLYNESAFWENVVANAHGLIFDVMVVGSILLSFRKHLERKAEIRKYRNEIMDFRICRNSEGAARVSGNAKRLLEMGVSDIDLSRSFLKKTDFRGIDLTKVTLWAADFEGATLHLCNLSGVKLKGCILIDTDCAGSNFSCADMRIVKGRAGCFSGCNFKDANLRGADFANANLRNAQFAGANLQNVTLAGADIGSADFRTATGLTATQLLSAKSVTSARVSEQMLTEIQGVDPKRIHTHTLKSGETVRRLQ